MKVPLTGGAYRAKSVIADAQRCINLYPEANPPDSPFPLTHYPKPGLTLIGSPPVAGVARGLYRASTGALYAVVGHTLYSIAASGQFTALGTIAANTTPVSMSDNGTDLVLVDGTANGYTVALATNTFAPISDPNFLGANRVDFIDTFFVLNEPGTPTYYTSNSNAVSFDGLYFADKTGAPDPLAAVIVMHDEIWLIGTLTSEVWYNAGAATFPFQKQVGVFFDHGSCAPFSVARQDQSVFFLSQDAQGSAVVLQTIGYQAVRISTHAIEAEFQSYKTLADAIAWTYQQGGHTFYVLRFPTADRTWVYDVSTQFWHERASFDTNGNIHQQRGTFGAFAFGMNLTLDWQTGALYKLDQSNLTDNGAPVQRVRGFPCLGNDGVRVVYTSFIADIDVGQAQGLSAPPPQINLRWSDTRGASWGNAVPQSAGGTGQYLTSTIWRRLGMGRNRVFELSWSHPYPTALNGAFVELQPAAT